MPKWIDDITEHLSAAEDALGRLCAQRGAIVSLGQKAENDVAELRQAIGRARARLDAPTVKRLNDLASEFEMAKTELFLAGGHQQGFDGKERVEVFREAEARLAAARKETEAIIEGFRQITASAGDDPRSGPVYNITGSNGVIIGGSGNSSTVSINSGSGEKSGRKGLEWTPIVVALIAFVSAAVVALIGLYKPDKSEPPAPTALPSSIATVPKPASTTAPTTTPAPSQSPVPFACRESAECPAGFAYIGRLYGESNQGNPAFRDRREIILPPHFRLDTSYQQPNVNCCGGGATAPLSPADIPRGIFIRPEGTIHWSTWEPRLDTSSEQMKFSMMLYCGPEAWPGRGCNVHVDVCAKCSQ